MKKTLVLSGLLACMFTAPSLHATPDSFQSQPPVTPKAAAKRPASKAAASEHATYYITSVGATGSHLPLVVCHYKKQYFTLSPLAVYGQPQLDRTGQLSVGGELIQRDPAISSVGGLHR